MLDNFLGTFSIFRLFFIGIYSGIHVFNQEKLKNRIKSR